MGKSPEESAKLQAENNERMGKKAHTKKKINLLTTDEAYAEAKRLRRGGQSGSRYYRDLLSIHREVRWKIEDDIAKENKKKAA